MGIDALIDGIAPISMVSHLFAVPSLWFAFSRSQIAFAFNWLSTRSVHHSVYAFFAQYLIAVADFRAQAVKASDNLWRYR
jgi:hypothetical protein